MIKRLTLKEEKVFCLDTNTRSVTEETRRQDTDQIISFLTNINWHLLQWGADSSPASWSLWENNEWFGAQLWKVCDTVISITLSEKLSGADFPSLLIFLYDLKGKPVEDAKHGNQMWARAVEGRIHGATNSVRN